MIKFLPGEIEIISSNANRIILTNLRILSSVVILGGSNKEYIFLEDISFIRSVYKSNLIFLLLALLGLFLVIGGFNERGSDAALMVLGGILFSALMIFLYYYTRKHFIKIASNGNDSIVFSIERMSDDDIDNFTYALQDAKSNRVKQLHNNTVSTNSTYFENQSIEVSKCPSCKHPVNPEDTFCENCGLKLK